MRKKKIQEENKPKSYIQPDNSLNAAVNEPVAVYNSKYDVAMEDPETMMELTREGIGKNRLLALSEKINIPVAELTDLLHISLRTIQRYEEFDRLDSHISEHIMLIDRLYRKGYELFSTKNGFNEWMKKPKHFFKDRPPVSMIDTYSGIETIMIKLIQMEHGIFA